MIYLYVLNNFLFENKGVDYEFKKNSIIWKKVICILIKFEL